jgi:hypothetical protein
MASCGNFHDLPKMCITLREQHDPLRSDKADLRSPNTGTRTDLHRSAMASRTGGSRLLAKLRFARNWRQPVRLRSQFVPSWTRPDPPPEASKHRFHHSQSDRQFMAEPASEGRTPDAFWNRSPARTSRRPSPAANRGNTGRRGDAGKRWLRTREMRSRCGSDLRGRRGRGTETRGRQATTTGRNEGIK